MLTTKPEYNPEYNPWNPRGRTRELTSESCLLISTWILEHTQVWKECLNMTILKEVVQCHRPLILFNWYNKKGKYIASSSCICLKRIIKNLIVCFYLINCCLKINQLGILAYSYNSSTQESKARGFSFKDLIILIHMNIL